MRLLMVRDIFLIAALLPMMCLSAEYRDLFPVKVNKLEFSEAKEKEWNEEYEKIPPKMREMEESYWDVHEAGCSWYACCSRYKASATTNIPPQGGVSYDVKKVSDDLYNTAWVVAGDEVGKNAKVTFTFGPQHVPVTTIIVVNGYVKSSRAYYNNSRPKKMKVTLDGEPIGILNLNDQISAQEFEIPATERVDREMIMEFEILDVYPGKKWDDVAITEIYFDGTGCH